MNTKRITMVDPMQIVKRGYKGCNSTRTVKNFAAKNHLPCCYWKPRGGEKVMLIEISSFRDAWNQVKNNRTSTSRTTNKTSPKTRTTAKRSTKTRAIAKNRIRSSSRTTTKRATTKRGNTNRAKITRLSVRSTSRRTKVRRAA